MNEHHIPKEWTIKAMRGQISTWKFVPIDNQKVYGYGYVGDMCYVMVIHCGIMITCYDVKNIEYASKLVERDRMYTLHRFDTYYEAHKAHYNLKYDRIKIKSRKLA